MAYGKGGNGGIKRKSGTDKNPGKPKPTKGKTYKPMGKVNG